MPNISRALQLDLATLNYISFLLCGLLTVEISFIWIAVLRRQVDVRLNCVLQLHNAFA